MRIKFMSRSEALPVLKAVDPADLLQEVMERGVKTMPPENLMTKKAECPHCGLVGPVGRDFGVRVLGGTVRAQSWCRECRKNPKRGHVNEKKAPQGQKEMIEQLKASLAKLKIGRKELSALTKAFKHSPCFGGDHFGSDFVGGSAVRPHEQMKPGRATGALALLRLGYWQRTLSEVAERLRPFC